MTQDAQVLADGLRAMGMDPGDMALELLGRYLQELRLWNPRLGLVDRSKDDLVHRHILDCAAAVPIFELLLGPLLPGPPGTRLVADLGSGAGLPGMVLAILMPEIEWELVEKAGRRCNFLRNCKALLKLDNVRVREQGYEELEAGRYDLLTNRAFRPLDPETLDAQVRILKPGGYLALYKGREQVIIEELKNARRRGSRLKARDELSEVPGNAGQFFYLEVPVPGLEGERHLLLSAKPKQNRPGETRAEQEGPG